MPCWYCGIRLRKIGSAMRTKDHVVPKSRGGRKTVNACLKCNAKKKDLSLEEFRALRGGIEFWGERTARLEAEKIGWIYEFDAAKNTITPVEYERPFYTPTVEKVNIYPVATRTKQETKAVQNYTASNFPPDLVGVQFGAFTVLRRLTGKWEVECMCGAIDHRSSKAVTNPANSFDCCEDCRKPLGKLRSEIYKTTGVELSWEECFKQIYAEQVNI